MATIRIPTVSDVAHKSKARGQKRAPELFDERLRNKAVRGASDGTQAPDTRAVDSCLSAGVIPYDATGFWLCKMRSNNGEVWADFGGKREAGETAWDTARREAKEEGGLVLEGPAPAPLFHPDHPAKAAFFLVETSQPPRVNEHKVLAVQKFTELPKELHPRLKYDKGALVRKALGALAFPATEAARLSQEAADAPQRSMPEASLAFMDALRGRACICLQKTLYHQFSMSERLKSVIDFFSISLPLPLARSLHCLKCRYPQSFYSTLYTYINSFCYNSV